jgi:chemotaxis protein methyltransferase CheR
VSDALSSSLLAELSRRIEAWTGLFFPPERWADLERKLHAAAPALGCVDAEACARLLATSSPPKPQLDLLATHLTVGETYFFREPRSFEALEHHILPALLFERRGVDQRLRFWSAACCTGEEPYSIAMLLHRAIPDLASWKTKILATDISPRFLHKAAEGVYGQWSFRNAPPAIQTQYFRQTPTGQYAIRAFIKNMVDFSQLNLVEDVYPSPENRTVGIDVTFCRNVLIYFTAERIRRILAQLYCSLNEGGWLIVSPVETAFVMDSPFTAVQLPGVTLFRRETDERTVRPACILTAAPPSDEPFHAPASLAPHADTRRENSTFTKSDYSTTAPPVRRAPENRSTETPTSPSLRSAYERARALYACGQYAETIHTLEAACGEENLRLSEEPLREHVMMLLARAYANQGRLPQALAWCEQALAVNKVDPNLYYLHATILLECGREAEARLSLTHALHLDPCFVLAHFTLGNLARQRRAFTEADTHFAAALVLLQRYQPEDVLPESEGMSAGRLAQIITDMRKGM